MPTIHEVATLTSKGQITLPKSIRQALGADTGSKLAFELRGGEVIVPVPIPGTRIPPLLHSWPFWLAISRLAGTFVVCRKI